MIIYGENKQMAMLFIRSNSRNDEKVRNRLYKLTGECYIKRVNGYTYF